MASCHTKGYDSLSLSKVRYDETLLVKMTNVGSRQTAQMNFCSILDLEAGCLKSLMYVVSLRLTCVNERK